MTTPVPYAPGHALLPGYEVDEHLARGQALDVYAVWSEERHCLCVAKTLRADRHADGDARERLLREGDLLHRLAHPNLVRGYETHDAPLPVIIMETLTGQTLSHLVTARRRPLAGGDLVLLGVQLCSVLRYLHGAGILHLDLKSSNVIADAGRARVLDLSHARPPGPCPTGFGTREYMPPEQLLGHAVSEASDVYGLGGVLYRTATRQRPFGLDDRESDPHRRPSFTRLRRRRLPAQLIELIVTCLDPAPAGRPRLAEAADVLDVLVEQVDPVDRDAQREP